ncbi:zinc finger BED domain-containing protein RICESLEEPER 2-like [Zingiber officinale]|uniref:zinc finger BED domain-containing protein RICESLEEPER 2-like n=1 Tax=Zingiber officinale TaxID=94328 RepID=UPI001C4D09AC|nr:zinc finger BED domain-containing protein RICESLEEPER 2-like [Zingiber officinale]
MGNPTPLHSTFRRCPRASIFPDVAGCSLRRRRPFTGVVPSQTPSLRKRRPFASIFADAAPFIDAVPSPFTLRASISADVALVIMEINDNEVEGAMLTTPTVGSEVHAATESHSQNESVPIEANEATLNNTLDVEISGTNGEKKRKFRSIAWDHFEKKLIEGKWKAPTKSNDGTTQLGTYHFNQDQARAELANMIILHEYPLSMVDHVGFRRYSYALQPIFKVVSRNTIKTDIMKIFEYERNKTIKLLDLNASRIALTTDMWTTSNQKRGLIAITSHFIDVSWKLQSRLVRFIYVPCPHTAEVLANALVDCLLDWNLDRKLSTLTVDNCTTNDAMIELILDKLPPSSLILEGKLFHMRCCAHILNLVVRDGLELISDSIETIRYSVAFWTATPKRDEKFIETARQLKVPSTKKLELDCKTRWNSTYLMLNTALEYEAVFAHLKQRETLYKRVPTQEDWSKVRDISSKLEMFFDATELFSGTKYPTINLFFATICDIKLAIGDWLLSDDNLVKTMATNMKVKFEKYWDIMNCLLAIGSILDPRYKMKTVQFYYPLVYGDMSSYEIEKLKKKLYDMVEEYEKKSKQSQKVKNSQSSSLRPPLPKRGSYADKFEMFMDSNTSTEHKSDLDYYLEESLLPRTSEFDILCWWKTNGIKYPILHDIAKDVLAIPVTTVASESTFSTSGRVLNAHRSKLHSKTVEALMCARDWLWSEIQDSTISKDQKFDNDADIEESESCSRTVTDSNSI